MSLAPRTRFWITGLFVLLAVDASTSQEQINKYGSVREILRKSPFEIVTFATFQRKIKTGKVVVLLFNDTMVDKSDGFTARMYGRIEKKMYPTLTFIAVPYDQHTMAKQLRDLGFTFTPSIAFYVDGKRVFLNTGGPANASEVDHYSGTIKRNLDKLAAFGKGESEP